MCDCLTVVYVGSRHLITFGTPGTLAAYTLADLTGTDVNGDGLPDLVVFAWSGGAHCCYSSGVYSVGEEDVKPVLALATGNCGPGEFEDLDGDGTREFVVCDDRFANMYCSFADSPRRSPRRRRGYRSQAATMWVSISAVCCDLSSG